LWQFFREKNIPRDELSATLRNDQCRSKSLLSDAANDEVSSDSIHPSQTNCPTGMSEHSTLEPELAYGIKRAEMFNQLAGFALIICI